MGSLPPASLTQHLQIVELSKFAEVQKQMDFTHPLGLCFELGNTHYIVKQTFSILMVDKQGSG